MGIFNRCVRITIASLAAFLVLGCTAHVFAQSIELEISETEAWLPEQSIAGSATAGIQSGAVIVNGEEFTFEVEGGRFETEVMLSSGVNEVVACADSVCSDTARWVLGYPLRPEVFAFAEVSGRNVRLRSEVLEAPHGPPVSYTWDADLSNPSTLELLSSTEAEASVSIPESTPYGEYYFNLTVMDSTGVQGRARTFVTVDSIGLSAFDIGADHAAWIDRAIVYEVTPYIFESGGGWSDVTARLAEIANLGVNTLWIQPVFEAQMEGPGTSGQGYGITNYFKLRRDLGSEDDLRHLVRSAKEDYGMRVLFDFVPNHTSIEHRYAQDVLAHDASSRYHDFYLTETDDVAYSQFYTRRGPFIYYFWDRLVIIDWSNPEVYRWMMEAARKWIEEYDIDGYRIDAVWGVNARTPTAMQRWRFDLKRLKPEIFLLGEDKATWPSSFENRFDAAYDWYPEESWVSHWTWQTNYSETSNLTIFNSEPVEARSSRLRDALTNRGAGWHPDAKVFRFLQNNDTFPFIEHHGVDRTKMAGKLLFALPGIPMIYNGQEIGHDRHPYGTSAIFRDGESIRSQDPYGFYEHYRDLSSLRRSFPVFTSDTYEELELAPDNIRGQAFAFRRWSGDMHLVAVVNMGESEKSIRLSLPLDRMAVDPDETHYLTDVMTGQHRLLSGAPLRYPVVRLPGYSTGLYMLSSREIQVPTHSHDNREAGPLSIALEQNYPNPFNPSTTISFELPNPADVTLKIYDVLGRRVATVVEGSLEAGRHTVSFDAVDIASGMYFYRLEAGGRSLTRQMLLTK